MTPTDLLRTIESARDYGWFFCDWRRRARDGEPEGVELDEFVYATLGDKAEKNHEAGYREITAAEARHCLAHWMKHSLAYGPFLNGSGLVDARVEPFFRVFSDARYFTNTYLGSGNIGSWNPKTLHTFDSGVVAVDATNIGLIWFAEED